MLDKKRIGDLRQTYRVQNINKLNRKTEQIVPNVSEKIIKIKQSPTAAKAAEILGNIRATIF